MRRFNVVLAISLTCLLVICTLVFLFGVSHPEQCLHVVDSLASSGQASGFLRNDAANLLYVGLFASLMGFLMGFVSLLGWTMIPPADHGRLRMKLKFLSNRRLNHYIVATAITALVLITYLPCLDIWFLGDDYLVIKWGLEMGFAPIPNFFHYNPIGLFFMGLPARLFGLNGAIYHINIIALHIVNCILLYFFAQYLTERRDLAFMSALFYAVFSLHYEAVFWIVGQTYQLNVLFSILSVWLFIIYLRKKKWYAYMLSLAVFTANILTYEQGITVLGICFFYELFVAMQHSGEEGEGGWLVRYMKMGIKYIPPFCLILALTVFKAIVVGSTGIYVVSPLKVVQFLVVNLMSFTTPGFYFGIVGGLRLAHSLPGLVISAAVFLLFAYYLLRKNRLQFFLFSWIIVTILPLALFGSLSSRNFALPAVAYSILLAQFVSWASAGMARIWNGASLQRSERIAGGCNGWMVTMIAVILLANFMNLRDRQRAWSENSDLARSLTKNCIEIATEFGATKEIYFVGRPMTDKSGDFWPPPPPFGSTFKEEIAFRTGIPEERIFDVISAPGNLEEFSIKRAANTDAVVFVYDEVSQRFKQVTLSLTTESVQDP